MTSALAPFRAAPHVTAVSDPYRLRHVAADGHIAFASVQFDIAGSTSPSSEATALMHDAKAARARGDVQPGRRRGGPGRDARTAGPSDGIGVGAAAIVLLIAFGSLLAMGLPIATALLGIGSGLSLIALLGHVLPGAVVLPHRGRADRAGRRRGLRAVHRDQVPGELRAGQHAPEARWSPRCAPRAGRCSPRAPRW